MSSCTGPHEPTGLTSAALAHSSILASWDGNETIDHLIERGDMALLEERRRASA